MKTSADLDRLFVAAEQVDDKTFSEMRSNILLVSGNHYTKKGSKFWDRVRNNKGLSESQKLRLTKNHTQKICKDIVAKILTKAPNTIVSPNNMDEMQDQKTAELNNSVWDFTKRKHKMRKKIRKFAKDFVNIGECYCKVFFDPNKGQLIGYEPQTNEDGEPSYTADGDMIPDKNKPRMSGDFVFERILPFNLLRCPNSQSLQESPYLIVRKMVEKAVVKKMLDNEEDYKIVDNMEETYLVFDNDRVEYSKEDKKIMLREFYYRPCMEYPNGYFYISIKGKILAEGELPFGVFPIASGGFEEIPTSARHYGPVKHIRPYQIEINRAASKIAETQITLGDDKLILMSGSKMSNGGKLSGVRAVTVTGGKEPKVLSGRSGEQYLGYMNDQIEELYRVMDSYEDSMFNKEGKMDPYALLYKSARSMEKFSSPCEEFEEFVCDITDIFLELARHYYDENTVIPMIGKSEVVNMAEFKHSEPMRYRTRVEANGDDVNTMMGRQLSINHTLQYVGSTLDKQDIGRFLKAMPFMNEDEMFGDFTIDYEMSKNDMLAMERGEVPLVNRYDNHKYLIQRAVNRIKQADFKFLPEQVQQLYANYIQMHQAAEAEIQRITLAAQSQYIPADGPLITVDYYTTDSEGKTKRAKFPQRAVEWLENQLAAQGSSLEEIENMNKGAVAEIGQMVLQR